MRKKMKKVNQEKLEIWERMTLRRIFGGMRLIEENGEGRTEMPKFKFLSQPWWFGVGISVAITH